MKKTLLLVGMMAIGTMSANAAVVIQDDFSSGLQGSWVQRGGGAFDYTGDLSITMDAGQPDFAAQTFGSPVTLADGHVLRVTADVSTTATNASNGPVRIGLGYSSPAVSAPGDQDIPMEGYFYQLPQNSGTDPGVQWNANSPGYANINFFNTLTSSVGSMALVDTVYVDSTPKTAVWSTARNGNLLTMSGSLGGTAFTTTATTDAAEVITDFKFNTVALAYLYHSGETATWDNLTVEHIPVPFSDNFNSADSTSVSAGINDAGRQSGGLAPSGYSESGVHTIVGGQLVTSAATSIIATDADFTGALTDPSITEFTLSFDAANTGTSWVSPYLSTHSGDERGNSEFGLLLFRSGTVTAYATDNNDKSANDAQIEAALGSSFDISQMNSYSLVATATTTTSGTYDVFINGTEVLSDVAYTFGSGGSNGEINWEEIHPGGGVGVFDNLLLTTIPEPATLALAAVGLGGLRRRRRSCR